MSKSKNDEVIDWYKVIPKIFLLKADNPNFEYHGMKIPFYGIISGASGSKKTQMATSIMKAFSKGKGTFATIKVFVKSAQEPLYQYLQTLSRQIQIYEGLEGLQKGLDLSKVDIECNSLYIFDDLCLESLKHQKPILECYQKSRKFNVSCLYLTQDFFSCPIFIRKNSRYIFIMRLSNQREMNLVLKDYGNGVNKDTLQRMYNYCVQEDKGIPLLIDIETVLKRFRKGLREYLNPSDF